MPELLLAPNQALNRGKLVSPAGQSKIPRVRRREERVSVWITFFREAEASLLDTLTGTDKFDSTWVQAEAEAGAAHVGGGVHAADDRRKGHEAPVLVLPHLRT